MKASIVSELNGPWHSEEIEIDEPHANEVKVKMAFAGMCHSDEHIRTGDMVPDESIVQMLIDRNSIYPIVGGHEGSGVVESVGANVTTLKPGDHVATSFIPSCGRCESCASGRQYLCDLGAQVLMGPMMSDHTWRYHLGDVNLNRVLQLGTFSEYIVADEASLIRIEPWYDLRAAALISCGLSTGFGAAVTRGGTKPGDT
ncbi:MAG: alcohol dehydrogenase catalytic domain-containing protein, partial [Acidimicrobiales bacterium]